MRKLRYQVAASLDGFITDAQGAYDWIPDDPDIDFGALFAQFDTLLMGRTTWQGAMEQQGESATDPDDRHALHGLRTVVVSKSLRPQTGAKFSVIGGDQDAVNRAVLALKAEAGKDIWLYGGGRLCATLLDAGLVDTVEIAIVPVLLGQGTPMVAPTAGRHTLRFTAQRVYASSGIVLMSYDVVRR